MKEMRERIFYYDKTLEIEIYCFQGIKQSFPNHFHKHYVIGLLENGKRILKCKNHSYSMEKEAFFLLNPNENHSCISVDNMPLYYRGINITTKSMEKYSKEITGKNQLLYFQKTVCYDTELRLCFLKLHKLLLKKEPDFLKEELFFIFLTMLLKQYSYTEHLIAYNQEVEKVCQFIQQNYNRTITLEELCQIACLSKSTLLRAFTKTKGITPYRYLETVRINEAKALLQRGTTVLETAMQTGFSDQSHFHHFFMKFIGIPPGEYRAIWYRKK